MKTIESANWVNLIKQKKDYETLIGIFDSIPSLSNEQFDVINKYKKQYEQKLESIKNEIAVQENIERTIMKRYTIIRLILISFAILVLAIGIYLLTYVFRFSSGNPVSILSDTSITLFFIPLILFLTVQYVALLLLELTAKKKKIYILGLLLSFMPLVLVAIKLLPNDIFNNNFLWILAIQCSSIFNLVAGLYDRLGRQQVSKQNIKHISNNSSSGA
jgi:magnesium-transporting ATPase (P-type)